MKIETQCLHEGYTPKNGEPRVVPIVQSTTYVYDSSREIAEVFDDPTKSLIYSRFENPTTDAVEKKIAALEGGAAAMCTSSGQAATLCSILNICQAGDSFIASTSIYGGTINLFSITMKRLGIECIYVDPDATDEEIIEALRLACAWDFVEKLPDGIQSSIKERGGGFSEGQAQRLAIARALISNAPIILLDEATSALDKNTEEKVLDNIKKLNKKTCIIITHKAAALEVCNREFIIKDKQLTAVRKEAIN